MLKCFFWCLRRFDWLWNFRPQQAQVHFCFKRCNSNGSRFICVSVLYDWQPQGQLVKSPVQQGTPHACWLLLGKANRVCGSIPLLSLQEARVIPCSSLTCPTAHSASSTDWRRWPVSSWAEVVLVKLLDLWWKSDALDLPPWLWRNPVQSDPSWLPGNRHTVVIQIANFQLG